MTEKSDELKDIEYDFGMTIARAASKAGMRGMNASLPAADITDVTVHASILYAATMSQRHLTELEFVCMCRQAFEAARKAHTP